MRSTLYLVARLMGDVKAVLSGRILQRLWNKLVGRLAGRLMR